MKCVWRGWYWMIKQQRKVRKNSGGKDTKSGNRSACAQAHAHTHTLTHTYTLVHTHRHRGTHSHVRLEGGLQRKKHVNFKDVIYISVRTK